MKLRMSLFVVDSILLILLRSLILIAPFVFQFPWLMSTFDELVIIMNVNCLNERFNVLIHYLQYISIIVRLSCSPTDALTAPRPHWPPPLKWPTADSCTNNLNSITGWAFICCCHLQQQTICRPYVPGLIVRSCSDAMELLILW